MDHLSPIYRFHDHPVMYVYTTLHYYEKVLAECPTLRRRLASTIIGALQDLKPLQRCGGVWCVVGGLGVRERACGYVVYIQLLLLLSLLLAFTVTDPACFEFCMLFLYFWVEEDGGHCCATWLQPLLLAMCRFFLTEFCEYLLTMGDITWQPPAQYYLKLLTRLNEGGWGVLKVGVVADWVGSSSGCSCR